MEALTIQNIQTAIRCDFWLNEELHAIVNQAEKAGYILRSSHTQAEWTHEGLVKACKELPLVVNGYSIRYNAIYNQFQLSHPEIGACLESFATLPEAKEYALKG